MAGRWPIQEATLDELDLDVENVRIPGEQADQPSVLKYLVEAEDVLSLANDMLRDGYIDIEPVVVTREKGRYVVLEGNRRTAALKCIADRTSAGKQAARMGRILSKFPHHDVPTQIRITVAPSRAIAQPLLARLHTGEPKRRWEREQQAVFYHSQLDGTTTVDDIKERFPGLGSRVVRFIKMGEMRKLIREMTYRDKDLATWVKSGSVSMSTLEYAYRNAVILEALGLAFDKDGMLTSHKLSTGQRRAIEHLLTLLKDKALTTRSAEFSRKGDDGAAQDSLAEDLQRLVDGRSRTDRGTGDGAESGGGDDDPDARDGSDDADDDSDTDADSDDGSGAGSAGGHGGTGGGSGGGTGGDGERGPNRGDTKERLDFAGFVYAGSIPGMRRRWEELRKISVKDRPNAAYDLLRTVLECTIKEYLREKGQPLAPGKTLGDYLTALAADFSGDRRLGSMVRKVQAGKRSGRELSGTADGMNFGNHEPSFFVTHAEVHDAWDALLPLFKEIEARRAALEA